jgi:hypothetical protein
MRIAENLIGQKFGCWSVTGREIKNRKTIWKCKCVCGTERLIVRCNLTRGQTTNCGCLQRLKTAERLKTHGESKTKLYGVWCAMRRRCYLKTTKDYKNYGARGIKVCDQWNEGYQSFKDWALQFGYVEGLTLERNDVNGDYTPDNCAWITKAEQAKNTRRSVMLTIEGETKPLTQWAEIHGMNKGTLGSRYRSRRWSMNEILIPSKGVGANGTTARL